MGLAEWLGWVRYIGFEFRETISQTDVRAASVRIAMGIFSLFFPNWSWPEVLTERLLTQWNTGKTLRVFFEGVNGVGSARQGLGFPNRGHRKICEIWHVGCKIRRHYTFLGSSHFGLLKVTLLQTRRGE